jgi:hypothetical protein
MEHRKAVQNALRIQAGSAFPPIIQVGSRAETSDSITDRVRARAREEWSLTEE